MKPHPRIRKTVKWGGAAVTVLLVVVWIGSGWRAAALGSSTAPSLGCYDGRFTVGQDSRLVPWRDSMRDAGWRPDFRLHWRLDWNVGKNDFYLAVPLWIPTFAWILTTAAAWRLDTLARRRAMLNLCPECNYDRAGLAPGAVCPECGLSAPTSPASSV